MNFADCIPVLLNPKMNLFSSAIFKKKSDLISQFSNYEMLTSQWFHMDIQHIKIFFF